MGRCLAPVDSPLAGGHATVWEGYRRALVRRFPYAIFYEVTGSDVIVYGVMHTARDEQKWRDRLT